jgi:hypothetical protein
MSDGIPKDHFLHPDGEFAKAIRTSVEIWCTEMDERWKAKAYGEPYVSKRADGVQVMPGVGGGGMCPYQCKGQLSDGRFFYGRLRWGTFTLCIGDDAQDAVGTEESEGLCLWMECMDLPEGAMMNKEFRYITTLHLGWDWTGLTFGAEPVPEGAT